MKSYLSLIPISAKVHRRQNRMTLLCIIISVLLVTTIFSAADMTIRGESLSMQDRHGSWHIRLNNISQDIAEEIGRREDVTAVGSSAVFNFDADKPYYIGERSAALYSADEPYLTQLTSSIEEGVFPQNDNEVVLSSNAKLALNVQLGDRVTIHTPAGDVDYTISAFGSDDREYYAGQTYLVAVYMTETAFSSLMEKNNVAELAPVCYVKFHSASDAAKAITEIREEYDLSEDSISENTAVMGIAGKSSNESIINFYGIAAVLFLMVLLAGVLMISGSMNSNVAQRTKFFGMMRCIGASRSQIIRFVRLEALNWCKTAVPIGLVLGTVITWGLCALLHYGIGGEFAFTPVFALSPIGLISGALVGIVTVLLAAQAPAKRASKVSPVAAVSGSIETMRFSKHASRKILGNIEWTLGAHHATESKKNLLLMTASFSLSIILFLCFSVGLDFARALVPSLRSWQPDITLNGYANSLVLQKSMLDEISSITGVEHVYGTSYIQNVSADSSREGVDHVNLVSYSDYLLNISSDAVVEGDIAAIYGNSGQVMTISNKDNPLQVGDTIQIDGKEVVIACAVSSGVYPSEYSVICSSNTFEWLTGEENYSLIGIQLSDNADDETIQAISNLADNDVIFSDLRESNRDDAATYLAAQLVLYSFLAIIAMITLFNIVNSISMSVTAHIRQYGAMRAVGMDGRQLTRMICAEALTYAVWGLVIGCGAGLLLSRFLHLSLITRYFGTAWSLPLPLLCIIVLYEVFAVFIAVYTPAKRIRNMAITETINEL